MPLPCTEAAKFTGASGSTGIVIGAVSPEDGPVPTEFVAVTEKVYEAPLVSPMTVIGELDPVPVNPPGLEVTVYEVMAFPPSEIGAEKETEASALPAVAVPIVGAPGTVAGVTELEAEEALPVPTMFVAVTVNVYGVPLVRPVTVIGELAPVPVIDPGLEVTVYEVMALPPFEPGAENVTEAWALPPVAVPMVGAPGTVLGVAVAVLLALPWPAEFTALILKS